MEHKIVNSERAPAPIGPYSQAVRAGGVLYTSGQIGLDPATGAMINESFAAEVRRVLENLRAVLEAGGAGLEQVVKTTIFLTELECFAEFNAIYGEYFGTVRPARSTVQVAALPKGARIEIEAVAVVD